MANPKQNYAWTCLCIEATVIGVKCCFKRTSMRFSDEGMYFVERDVQRRGNSSKWMFKRDESFPEGDLPELLLRPFT